MNDTEQEPTAPRPGREPTDVHNLYRERRSGIYCARFNCRGRDIWRSLRTTDKAETVRRLVVQLPKFRAAAERQSMDRNAEEWQSEEQYSASLIGYWCRGISGDLFSGVIVSQVSPGAFLIKLVEAGPRCPTTFKVATVDQMGGWQFYKTRGDLEKSAKSGANGVS
jgi:hypothetical protein